MVLFFPRLGFEDQARGCRFKDPAHMKTDSHATDSPIRQNEVRMNRAQTTEMQGALVEGVMDSNLGMKRISLQRNSICTDLKKLGRRDKQ